MWNDGGSDGNAHRKAFKLDQALPRILAMDFGILQYR